MPCISLITTARPGSGRQLPKNRLGCRTNKTDSLYHRMPDLKRHIKRASISDSFQCFVLRLASRLYKSQAKFDKCGPRFRLNPFSSQSQAALGFKACQKRVFDNIAQTPKQHCSGLSLCHRDQFETQSPNPISKIAIESRCGQSRG